MPQVIAGPIALAAFNAGAPLAVVNAIVGVGVGGAIVHGLVGTALVVGASYGIAKLTAPRMPKPSDASIEFKQPIPYRFFTYGYAKVSGPILLLEMQDRELAKIVAFGTRELAAFHVFFVDGNEVPLELDGTFVNWTSGGTHYGQIATHLGADDQAADALALVKYSIGWTADHRLLGIPYVFANLESSDAENFQEAFPTGEPQFSCVGGVKVYDPRKDSTNGGSGSHRTHDKSTWEFSDNQALCTLDWITWPDGYGKSFDRIDWASWVAQIEAADEDVPLRDGGTEKRYRVATRVGLDEPRARVLRRLLDAGDQQLYLTSDGLIGTRGGRWEAPTVSLDVASFPEGSFTHGVPKMDRVNEFQLSAMLPGHGYGEVELEPWEFTAHPEHAAGIIRRVPLELTQVPSNGQAQRLAKIAMAKRNPRWSGQVRTSFAGLDAIGESVVDLTFDELDQPPNSFDGPFFINGKIAILPDKTGVTFPVSAIDPAAYDWDETTEEHDEPPLPFTSSEA